MLLACSTHDPVAPGVPVPPAPAPPPPTACVTPAGTIPSGAARVAITPSVRHQAIDGFGTTVRLFDDPHLTETFDPATQRGAVVIPAAEQQRILAALYTDLRLTRVRYATDPGIEPVNDNADPALTDLSKFNFAWKRLDGHVDYVLAARQLGVTTWFGSPILLEPWMGRDDPSEYVEWALVTIRRWRDRGATLPYWSILNEPGLIGPYSPAFVRDATKMLGARLAAEGIPTRLVVPDDLNPSRALVRAQAVMDDPDARRYVGALAYHLYETGYTPGVTQPDLVTLSALARQYNLPLWMTEWIAPDWFTWAATMHDMLANYDASAVDYMWGFFGQWEGTAPHLITITYTGSTYTGFVLHKQYHVMGQWSRFLPPGSTRVQTSSSVPNVLVSAYAVGDRVVVIAINTGGAPISTQFLLGAGTPCIRTVTGMRTSETLSSSLIPTATLSGPGILDNLPARSVTTFTFAR